MEDLISVIIPAYNAQTYLRQTLESVSAQSYKHFEAIVIDDGSTDATAAIVEQAMAYDSRIRLINKANGGLADARNSGLDAAHGEWVTFLDSDDRLLPSALERLVSAAMRSGCDIVIGGIVRRYAGGGEEKIEIISSEDAIENTLYQTHGLEPSACGKLYRRKLFDRQRFAKGVWYEDLDFFYRAYLQVGRVAVTGAPVYYYRCNPDGFLGSFKRERLDVLTVTERMERYFAQNAPHLLPAARDRRLSANFNMLGLLSLQPQTAESISLMRECEDLIKKHRSASLLNPKVRLKNRLGALVSYGGMPVLKSLLRRRYRERRRVVTLNSEELRDICQTVGYKVIDSGYKPDVIIGIRNGGAYVAEEIMSIFPEAELMEVELRRSGSNRKRYLRGIMRLLPMAMLDRLRILEAGMLEHRKREINDEVGVPCGLSGNLLVVDDAVDSGVTLASVVGSLRKRNPGADIRSAAITITTANPVMRPDFAVFDNMILIRFPWSTDWRE